MDKIIDGVDVSGCEFCMYEGFKAFPQCKLNKDSFATACVQHKDCYYKQLQRARAELEELHLKYAGCMTANNGLQELNAELKAENEKLKTDIGIYKGIIDADKEENERLKEEKGGMQILIDNYIALTEKYHQALQEIREIADIIANTNCYPVKEAQKIIDKINSVIGAEQIG